MAERVRSFLARWERFWFGEASLVRLALFRIVLLCAAFDGAWTVRKGVFQHAQGVDNAFARSAWNPIYAFELLGLGPPDLATARVLWCLLLVALVLGILGLWTRTACALVALLFFHWNGTACSFAKPHHGGTALMFGLCALPLAPVGARLSLDSLLRRLRAAGTGGDPLAVPERAAWAALPIRMTQLTIALGYFFSGASKLAISGLAWANGYTLMGIMVEFRSAWSEHVYGSQALLVLLSAGLLFGQLGFPLVFLGRGWVWLFVPLAVLFHVMAMMTMSTGTFLTLWLTLSCFLALERIPGFLSRAVGAGPGWRRVSSALVLGAGAWGTLALYAAKKPAWLPVLALPVVIALLLDALPRVLPALTISYDPASTRARRAVAWLSACDWSHRLAIVPGGSAGAGLHVHTESGRALGGTRALWSVLARTPLALPCAPFLRAGLRVG